jgi:hypothetical protein
VTLRFRIPLDSSGIRSDSGAMLTMLIITACIAAGTIVHHCRHERREW